MWSRSVSALGDTPRSSTNRALALAYAASAAAVLPDDACARMSIRSTSSSYGCSTSTASAWATTAAQSAVASVASILIRRAAATRVSHRWRATSAHSASSSGSSGPRTNASGRRRRHGQPRAGHRTARRRPPRPGDRSRRCRARLPRAGVSAGTVDQVLRTEHASQPRHEHTHLLSRLRRELESPQHVGRPIHRDDLTARNGEQLEQRACLTTPEVAFGDPIHGEPTHEPDPQLGVHGAPSSAGAFSS